MESPELRKKIRLAVPAALIAAVALTGCSAPSGSPETAAEPAATTAAPDLNMGACDSFTLATRELTDALYGGGNANDSWDELRSKFDTIGLKAEGDVKTRIQTVVSEWPSVADIVVHHNVDGINQTISDVGRACEAIGAHSDVMTFSEK